MLSSRLAGALCLGLVALAPAWSADRFLWDESGVVLLSDVGDYRYNTVADDFTVPATGETFRIEFADIWLQDWMELAVDGSVTGFDGTIGWAIYTDDAGHPGTLWTSGDDATATLLGPTVPSPYWDTQRVRFKLDPPVLLSAGTYWLAVREGAWGTPGNVDDHYAISSTTSLGNGAMWAPVGSVPASFSAGGGSDLAFVLYGSAFPWHQDIKDKALGSPVTSAVAANDFTLVQPFAPGRADVTVTDADATPDGVVDSLEGALGWGLYSDGGGMPGALLASGTTAAPLAMTPLGGNPTIGDFARVRVDLSAVGTLAPGTYWLALREGPWGSAAADATEAYWALSALSGSSRCTSTSLVTPGSWSCGTTEDLAFSLASELLFASGFESGATCAWTQMTAGACP